MNGSHLVREARRRMGMSQTDLARRVGTTQSAIARLEGGSGAPSLERITDLIRACGLDLSVRLVEMDDHDWTMARRNLELDHEDRVAQLVGVVRLLEAGACDTTT